MSLVQLTCGDLVPKWQVLVTLKATDTVQEALEELRDRHFRSVPVISSDGRPVGFVDVLDLVSYLVSVFPKPRLTTAVGTDISQLIEGEDLETFWQEAQFRMTTLQEANVINMSKHNPWVQLPRSTSLARAIGVFATGVHHIALTDESGKLSNVLSQMDIVRFMNTDAVALLGSDAFSTLKQLSLSGVEGKRIKCVRSNTPAIDAFCAMQRHGLSSVAVVNDNWQLMGNLSASDITVLTAIRFVDLIYSVSHFLAKLKHLVFRPRPVVVADENTSVGALVAKLVQNKVHRVWVVDADSRPHSVVTLTDLLAIFLRNGGEEKAVANLIPTADLQHRRDTDLRAELQDDKQAMEQLKKHASDSKQSRGDRKRIELLEARLAKASAVASASASAPSPPVPAHANPAVEKDAAHISDLSRRVEQLSEADAAAQHKPRAPQVLLPARPETPTDSTHLAPAPAAPMSPMAALAHSSPHVARPSFIEEL